MSRFNHQHKLSVKAYLYRILFLIAAIALLVICMPRESKSAMNYQKGEPWENDAFIAQDSFPILKSAEQVAREQDSLRQFYEPYFRLDAAVLERQQTALRQDFFEKATGTPQYFLPHLLEKLGHVYAMGILSGETLTRVEAENPRQVRIYRGNESTARQVSQIYSEKEAYEYLVAEKDSVHYNHALLRGLDLTKYITPNLAYDATKSAQQRSEVDGRLVKTKGIVLQGQKVVDRGQIVDDEVMCILLSWEQHRKEHKLSTAELLTRFGGKVAYVSVMLILLNSAGNRI